MGNYLILPCRNEFRVKARNLPLPSFYLHMRHSSFLFCLLTCSHFLTAWVMDMRQLVEKGEGEYQLGFIKPF